MSSQIMRAAGCIALSFCPAVLASASANAAPADPGIIALPLQPTVGADRRSCTQKTPSGLGYTLMRNGEGRKATAEDIVLVNYIGYLSASGIAFDQGMGSVFPVSDLIPGFTEGLQLLPKGGVVRLCVPSTLGYGAQASGPIPANADLVFQVELLDLRTRAEVEAMRAQAAASPPAAPAATRP